MFGITAILDPERMNFTYDDFGMLKTSTPHLRRQPLAKSWASPPIDALKAYLE